MIVSKIINGALKQLGIVAAGENARADELADALDCLHALLSQWATDQHYIYKSNLLILTLNGSGIYRIKAKHHSENFCCDYEISDCPICNSTEVSSEACSCGSHPTKPKVHLSADIQAIADTAWLDGHKIDLVRDSNHTASQYVPVIYSRECFEWLFELNDSTAKQLKIKAFTFPTHFECHDILAVPAHYERALRLSLALEIAPMFGVEPSMTLLRNQANAVRLLSNSNVTPIYATNSVNEIAIGVRRGRYH